MAELVDAPVLEAGTVRCEGSSPFLGTMIKKLIPPLLRVD
jgi:hypothetical protein